MQATATDATATDATATDATATDATETVALLHKYSERDVGSVEKTLVLVAIRWILAEPSATRDPLLTDLLTRARTPVPKRKNNILDYFGIPLIGSSQCPKKRYRIYCDGACSANGRRGAKGGYGAVLITPEGDEMEQVSEALNTTEPQTNQRAELRALQWAFGKAMSLPEGTDIHTDSQYSIKCFTEWGALWSSKGWRKAGGGDVLHQDILRPMWEIWRSRGTKIKLFHVSAHTGGHDIHSLGNAKADSLAVASLF